ncbi:ABC transporter ATP-binding protein [Paenibacillus sp. 2RAB27]|uniref:ABC transporter ATP-binding protein n=1 Tax=Paenibacillus sp. 2RAB27 TaxID=3232991 RepID=UPI003F96CF61
MEYVLHFTKRLYAFTGNKLMFSILGMVLISLLEGAGVFLLLPIISAAGLMDVNTSGSPISRFLAFFQEFPMALGLPIILGMFVLLNIGQNMIQRSLSLRDTLIQQNFLCHLRLEIYSALMQSNWIFFVKHRRSDLINSLTTELTRVGYGTNLILQFIASIIFTLIQIGIAFWLSPTMTVFVLTFGIILTFFSRKFIKKAKSIGGQTSQLSQSFLAGITDQLGGMKDIKSNTLEESRLAWFRSQTQKLMSEQINYVKLRSDSQLFYKVSSAMLIAAFMYLSFTLFQTKVEQLLLIIVIFSRLWPRFTGIQSNLENISSTIPAFQSIIKLQDELRIAQEFHIAPDSNQQEVQPIAVHEHIECQHLYFRYQPDEETFALTDINLQIKSLQTTAIVGRSGAGKSTLVDVIMGLIQPEKGQIRIDGVPLQYDQIRSFRRSISYVSQDPFLFHTTIRENLLMISPDVSEEEMWEALEFAAATEFVAKLPQGLDTVIGDRGVRFSGGERQRLVLARAILRKPAILVLDEATSALDTENEAGIQAALDRLKGKTTIIVIAHRLSTIRNADQVIVLDQGKIIQRGGFHQLAKVEGGLFSDLLGNQVWDATATA